jgi:hypothetical protein
VRARGGFVASAPAVWIAVAVFAVAAIGLSVRRAPLRSPVPPRAALQAVLRDAHSAAELRRLHWDRVSATPIDSSLERVRFDAGPRIVAEFAVNRHGHVVQALSYRGLRVPYGSFIAYAPAMLLGLASLFVLMTAVAPLRRLRNLDVLATLSLVVPVVLLQYRYLDASVLSSVPGLLYLMLRCASSALGRPRPAQPSTPLLELLTRDWTPAQRTRVLAVLLAALAASFLMVSVSSGDAVDVIYAVMEGATRIVHGLLPYGHMPGDVLHGDTYPLLSYLAYSPLALLTPVASTWDSVDLALGVSALAALLCAAGVYRMAAAGHRAWRGEGRPGGQEAGLRAALTWLSFPPVLIVASTGTTDLVLAAILLFAVVLWRRPLASITLLSLGGWFKLAPFALLPMWLAPLRGRRLLAAVALLVAVSGAMLAVLVALGGSQGPAAMARAVAYQFSRGSPQSVWSVLGVAWLQPVGQAAVLGLVAGACVRLVRDRELAGARTRIAALTAAIVIGLQLAADYWAFLYLVWMLPLVVHALMTPAEAAPALEPAAAPRPFAPAVPVAG